jgi:toxin ParE1/3/4
MAEVRLSKSSRRDLLEIADHSAEQWDEAQAERYITQHFGAFRRLVDNTMLGRPCDSVRPRLQRKTQGKHVIYFRREASGDILVVRVLHERMLPERHITGEDDQE